jgi:hypothetical protein
MEEKILRCDYCGEEIVGKGYKIIGFGKVCGDCRREKGLEYPNKCLKCNDRLYNYNGEIICGECLRERAVKYIETSASFDEIFRLLNREE